jgi:hypothetical protein
MKEPLHPDAEILRHEASDSDAMPPMSVGDEDLIDAVTTHFGAHLPGDPRRIMVHHELISPFVHLDVHFLPPPQDAKKGLWTLFTTGMAERPMNIPEQARGVIPPYAELMVQLPHDYPGLDRINAAHASRESLAELHDELNWVLYWMRLSARFVHEFGTWLGPGHTIPMDERYATGGFGGLLFLAEATRGTEGEFGLLRAPGGRQVLVLRMIPLYEEEVALKLHQGTDVLYALFDKHKVGAHIEPGRINVVTGKRPAGAKRKRFGIF